MRAKTLLIVGNDKFSAKALAGLQVTEHLAVAVDKSTDVSRVLRLVRRGSLTIGLLLRMTYCEMRRPSVHSLIPTQSVSSNAEVVRMIETHAPKMVVLFRAGLIIDRTVLATGVPIMNIHCARIPEYGGIGSINRALKDRAYRQCATLHQVTESIDRGIVHMTEPYELDPMLGYCANEDRAYKAGMRLLRRVLDQPQVQEAVM